MFSISCGESSENIAALLSESENSLQRSKTPLKIDMSTEQKISYLSFDDNPVLSGVFAIFPSGSVVSEGDQKVDIYIEPASLSLYNEVSNEFEDQESIEVTSSAPAVMIYPSKKLKVENPFTIAVPIPEENNLSLTSLLDNLVIFYKIIDFDKDEIRSGFKTKSSIKLSDDNKFLLMTTKFFGAFQAAFTKNKLSSEKEVKSKSAEIKSQLDSQVIFKKSSERIILKKK